MKIEELKDLFEKMTLEEKLGQLTQMTGEYYAGKIDEEMVETGPDVDELELTDERLAVIGSVLGTSSAEAVNLVQKKFLERNRLQIPLLFMHDAIHGYRTIFPIPLALSCSWDDETLKRVARWGRVVESFGEDHILSGNLGKAMIEGYQKGEYLKLL